MRTAREAAEAAVRVMGGATVAEVMSPHRGTPRAARVRWMAMEAYRAQGDLTPLQWTQVGAAFGRDRTSVRDGVRKLRAEMGARFGVSLRKVLKALREG